MINIIVTPPWYKTSWFIGIAAILFIITTAGIGYILFPTEREIYERQYEPLPTSYIERHLKKTKKKKIPVEENIPATELSSNRLVKEKNEKKIIEKTNKKYIFFSCFCRMEVYEETDFYARSDWYR